MICPALSSAAYLYYASAGRRLGSDRSVAEKEKLICSIFQSLYVFRPNRYLGSVAFGNKMRSRSNPIEHPGTLKHFSPQ